ncbi:MAG: TlyA family RNA methyltransferase [Bacteriovoracaceae bacterium]|nr:TlyA family RNA methyltransferase [Bacteriovoracaceae bacterium]
MKERIDKILVEKNLAPTRAQAKSLIEMGRVKANNKLITKAGELVESDSIFEVDSPGFVGRGAFKLEGALKEFQVSIQDKTFIDVGASTGGFTEILLREGAKKVFAVDVGRDQLADKLKSDPRVENMESTHILDVNFLVPVQGAVIDVSFISLTKIMTHVKTLIEEGGWIIALIKPQFEAGTKRLPKDGVIKDDKIRDEILNETLSHFREIGLEVRKVIDCPIEGKTGNREYLAHLIKNQNCI